MKLGLKLELNFDLKCYSLIPNSEPNTEGPKGWYRTKVPAIFLTIMERYILRRFTDATAVAKSPRTKKRTYQKIMSEHFQNIRIRYFKAKCNNAKTLDEMLNKRYDAQIEMFEKNYVSSCISLRD